MRLSHAGDAWMSALKSMDVAVISGQHSLDAIEHLNPDVPRSPGSQLYLVLHEFEDLVAPALGIGSAIVDRINALSRTRETIRRDVVDCEHAIRSVIFNSPIVSRPSP
jgi:hypothetical protein